ncbi:DUF309 domain-containing protein [filamentous cyanobacterium CCP5]|nr:DUF309 domain-containing protein [filamentous cyanobacterium CCP5]
MGDLDPQLAEAELRRGIEQFNTGQYYHCHDTLEAIWMVASMTEKPFYQGILQIAVGLHHLGNQNWRGAVTLLGEGINRLYGYEPSYRQVHVSQLIDQALDWLSTIQSLGPERVQEAAIAFDQIHRGNGEAAPSAAPNPGTFPTIPRIHIDPDTPLPTT